MVRMTEHRGKGTIIVDIGKHHESAIRRLTAIEDILGDEYDLDLLQKQIQAYREGRYIILKEPEQAGISRLRELAQADREGLVHIIQGPAPGASVCGNCKNFIRNPGTRTGVCKEQSCYRDHHGNDEPWRGTFSPSQSRKACRKFVRAREEDEHEAD